MIDACSKWHKNMNECVVSVIDRDIENPEVETVNS